MPLFAKISMIESYAFWNHDCKIAIVTAPRPALGIDGIRVVPKTSNRILAKDTTDWPPVDIFILRNDALIYRIDKLSALRTPRTSLWTQFLRSQKNSMGAINRRFAFIFERAGQNKIFAAFVY